MSFLSLLPATLAKKAQEAVKALPPAPRIPQSMTDAEACGYLTGELFQRTDHAGNARGEALALAIAKPEQRQALINAGCAPGPAIPSSFYAPAGWASGRSDVGQPIGLWTDEGREDAQPRPSGWKPRPAWDAIIDKPHPLAAWTVEGWVIPRNSLEANG